MAKDPRHEALAESQREIAQRTKEQLARSENVQPTPTQEENDRAKLGLQSLADLDDKEADGSQERDLSAGGAASYQTRAATPKK